MYGTNMVLARNLGVENFGHYNFLLTSFVGILQMMDMSSSEAFYTFISKKKQGMRFFVLYAVWLGVQMAFVLVCVAFLLPDNWISGLWLGHAKGLIILAFLSTFVVERVWNMVVNIGESIRKTIIVQVTTLCIVTAHFAIIITLVKLKLLTVSVIFAMTIFEYILAAICLSLKLGFGNVVSEEEYTYQDLLYMFRNYCTPLLAYGVIGFMYEFSDRWLLQRYGGAREQGFYFASLQLANVCLLFTTSIVKVFWKEISEAHHNNDKFKMNNLYDTISKATFFITAFVICFMFVFSKEILCLILGYDYSGGWKTFSLLLAYPLAQTLWQTCGVYLQATNNTKVYARIVSPVKMLSIPLAYIMLAPGALSWPGFGLASLGLAIKVVLSQFVGVVIMTYVISRMGNISNNMRIYAKNIAILITVAYICKFSITTILAILVCNIPLIAFIASGLIYALLVWFILVSWPTLIGFDMTALKKVYHVHSCRSV